MIKALADAVDARLIMGVNFEADNPTLTAAEGRAMRAGLGCERIDAFERRNKAELYGNPNSGYYVRDGREIPGRPPS